MGDSGKGSHLKLKVDAGAAQMDEAARFMEQWEQMRAAGLHICDAQCLVSLVPLVSLAPLVPLRSLVSLVPSVSSVSSTYSVSCRSVRT